MIEPTKTAAKAVLLAVLLADLTSSTVKAYACLSQTPPPEEMHCAEPGSILPSLGVKLAAAIQALSGQPAPPAPVLNRLQQNQSL